MLVEALNQARQALVHALGERHAGGAADGLRHVVGGELFKVRAERFGGDGGAFPQFVQSAFVFWVDQLGDEEDIGAEEVDRFVVVKAGVAGGGAWQQQFGQGAAVVDSLDRGQRIESVGRLVERRNFVDRAEGATVVGGGVVKLGLDVEHDAGAAVAQQVRDQQITGLPAAGGRQRGDMPLAVPVQPVIGEFTGRWVGDGQTAQKQPLVRVERVEDGGALKSAGVGCVEVLATSPARGAMDRWRVDQITSLLERLAVVGDHLVRIGTVPEIADDILCHVKREFVAEQRGHLTDVAGGLEVSGGFFGLLGGEAPRPARHCIGETVQIVEHAIPRALRSRTFDLVVRCDRYLLAEMKRDEGRHVVMPSPFTNIISSVCVVS